MKKNIVFLLVIVLMFALVGCGGDTSTDKSNDIDFKIGIEPNTVIFDDMGIIVEYVGVEKSGQGYSLSFKSTNNNDTMKFIQLIDTSINDMLLPNANCVNEVLAGKTAVGDMFISNEGIEQSGLPNSEMSFVLQVLNEDYYIYFETDRIDLVNFQAANITKTGSELDDIDAFELVGNFITEWYENDNIETIKMAAEMVGAIEGIKYVTPQGNVELYKFEPNSDNLASSISNNALTIEGFGDISATFNENYALIVDDNIDDKEIIIEYFTSI